MKKKLLFLILFVPGFILCQTNKETILVGNGEDIEYTSLMSIGGQIGQEIGSLIRNKIDGQLKSITIGIAKCDVKQKSFKLNLYSRKEVREIDERRLLSFPKIISADKYKLLNTEPIFFEVRPEYEKVGITVNLDKHNIKIKGDFLVGIEAIEGSDTHSPEVWVFIKHNRLKHNYLTRINKYSDWEILNNDRKGGMALVARIEVQK